jgi:hypothetical protein
MAEITDLETKWWAEPTYRLAPQPCVCNLLSGPSATPAFAGAGSLW